MGNAPERLDISIVIVNYRSEDHVRRCVRSVMACAGDVLFEIFVVDNSPGSLRDLPGWAREISLIEAPENLGFARACNVAILRSRGRAVLLLNPDTEVRPGAIRVLLRSLDSDPRVGVVGPRLLHSDGTLQPSCRPFPSLWVALMDCVGIHVFYPRNPLLRRIRLGIWDPDKVRYAGQPMGACLCLRREALEDVGLLDERFFVYFEEVDWCLRARRRDWRILYTPKAEVLHHAGVSASRDTVGASVAYYGSKRAYYRKHFDGPARFILLALLSCEVVWRSFAWTVRARFPGRDVPNAHRNRREGYRAAGEALKRARHAEV